MDDETRRVSEVARASSRAMSAEAWPSLRLDEWLPTCITLRWMQIVGKTRPELSPFENHWWHSALYVSARGVTTSPMPFRGLSLEMEFDFLNDALFARTDENISKSLRLEDRSVADFYGNTSRCSPRSMSRPIYPAPARWRMPRLSRDRARTYDATPRDDGGTRSCGPIAG